jgi:ubiquinone/menaquinone biosynthesis C-methylase UbiE
MTIIGSHINSMKQLWNSLNRKSTLGYISHLEKGQEWDKIEFHVTGIRFVDRMIERIEEYGETEPNHSNILEIGCGVGRFLKPLACRFKYVCGVDISEQMINSAKEYCRCLPNIEYVVNDGSSLKNIKDQRFDYCASAGVFQHITDIGVILSYIREAIRVLKPGGLFLFQFEGNRTEEIGKGQRGAKITARILDNGLRDLPFLIREISIDPKDAVRNVVIVLQKPKFSQSYDQTKDSFQSYKLKERRWISGVYDDVQTKTLMHKRQEQSPVGLTFYDQERVST